MFEDSTSYETAKANARLIASAPDMALELERVKALNAELVEALKGIKLLDVIDSIGLPSTAKNIIVDLIAKSEGRA